MRTFVLLLVFLFGAATYAETYSVKNTKKHPTGYKIVSMEHGNVFEKLGLQLNDEIVAIDGKTIQNGTDFQGVVSHLKENQKVKLTLLRNGRLQDVVWQFK